LQWRTFYLAAVDQDVEAIDPFSDHLDTAETGFFADTCYGVVNDDVNCRDVGFAEDYMLHTVSLRFSEDNWYASLGVRNLADKEPPRVDGNEISSVNNAAIGYGYDLMGRTVYANFGYNF
jgi:iron complex outermembrane receptor protein